MGMMVNIEIIKNNLSGEITLSGPEWRYLWCFRKGEFEPQYTVVPIEEFIAGTKGDAKIKNSIHYRRMVETFEYIRSLKPIKIIR